MIIEPMFLLRPHKYLVAFVLLILIIISYYLFNGAIPSQRPLIKNNMSMVASESYQQFLVPENNIKTTEQLNLLLQGRWRNVAGKNDSLNAEYYWFKFNELDWLSHKTYQDGRFTYIYYNNEGAVSEVYGGRYQIINPSTIIETTEFYGPYKVNKVLWWNGTKGNMIRSNGYSRVGSIFTATVRFEGNVMYQSGLTEQNVTLMDDPKEFKDYYSGSAFKKILP